MIETKSKTLHNNSCMLIDPQFRQTKIAFGTLNFFYPVFHLNHNKKKKRELYMTVHS